MSRAADATAWQRLGHAAPQSTREWAEALYLAVIVAVPLALMSVFGVWSVRLEPFVWLAVLVLYLVLIMRRESRNKVRLALWVGILVAVLYSSVQALFLPTYLSHDQALRAGDWSDLPMSQMRVLWVLKSPFIGLVYGIVLSVLVFAVQRGRVRRKVEDEGGVATAGPRRRRKRA